MRTPLTDIFCPVEENNDGNIRKEVEEEELREEEEKEEDTGSSEEDGEAGDNNEPDPWSLLRRKFREVLEETYLKEVLQFLGKIPTLWKNAAYSALLPMSRRL